MPSSLLNDIEAMKPVLQRLPTDWEGKTSILEMKEGGFQWRQMEWWAFYFELLCNRVLSDAFEIPGERFGNVVFDMKRSVNWDLKAKAIRSDSHELIINDQTAIDESIRRYGQHGLVVALCDVEYNDVNRSFQRWHTELKGGLSKYEEDRIKRTSVSRYRKTHAWLQEILFLSLDADNIELLGTMRQGRNSNGNPRATKYRLNLEQIEPFWMGRLQFAEAN